MTRSRRRTTSSLPTSPTTSISMPAWPKYSIPKGPQMNDRISVELQGQTRAVVTVATDRGDGGLAVEQSGITLTGVFAGTMPVDVVALLVEALPQANHAWFRLFGGPDPDDIVVP